MNTLLAEHAVWLDQRIVLMAEFMRQAQQVKDQILKEKELAKLRQKNTKIISAFPACGKTYACEKLKELGFKALDSDSSSFSWIERERTEEELQKLKQEWDSTPHLLSGEAYIDSKRHEKIKVRNPEFPANYIKHIKENIGKVDYIFVSSHETVREALIANKIHFSLVYPQKSMKAEWIGRCFLRGNDKVFCDLIAKMWDRWIDDMDSLHNIFCDNVHLRWNEQLGRTEYLYDLIKEGIL